MADKLVRLSIPNYNRLIRFGFAGESVDTALGRVLDLAEEKFDEKKDETPERKGPRSPQEMLDNLPEIYRVR